MAGGRPKVVIDWEKVAVLARLHSPQEDIAYILDCSVDTLNNASKRENGCSFSEYCHKRRAESRSKLRQLMWQSAQNGNVVMQIWLSKNELGYADKVETKAESAPLEFKFGWADEHTAPAADTTAKKDSRK